MSTQACPIGVGKRYGYVKHGCRCELCATAHRDYVQKWRVANPKKARQLQKDWRKKNPDKVTAQTATYRRSEKFKLRIAEQSEWLNRIKMDRGCIDCTFNKHPAALHFDHVRGIKEFEVGAKRYCSKEKLLAEIEKCDVRCANCHAIVTAERGQYGKSKSINLDQDTGMVETSPPVR